jgi:NAD(P)-dependent dehydrogenase (short-subunit alcohol dehydrogenase family)
VGQAMVKEQKGSIVLTSSMYGNIAPKPDIYHFPMEPNPLDYGVCKAGVQAMARYFCAMWGREGIRCNSLSPGPFPHDQLRKSEPGFIERLASRTPAQRVGRREEIAGPAVFLLSDASTYVNGQNLLVDGGWTAW